MIGRVMGIVAAVTLAAAPARAGCWTADEGAAAAVRQFQSMLMVAALRCQVSGHDITADYNGFVTANRATIGGMNDRLKAHFIHAAGPVAGQTAYDRFTTTLANAYGAAATSAEVCGSMASLAREASLMAGSGEGLLLLASREGPAPALDEDRCVAPPLTIAGVEGGLVLSAASPRPAAVPIQLAAAPQ